MFKAAFGAGLAAVALAAAAHAAGGSVTMVRVIHEQTPVYPPALLDEGVNSGRVDVALSIGADGKVDDCLAVAYTRQEFAQAAVAAIRHWTFDPARFDGRPVPCTSAVDVEFRAQGTAIVTMNLQDYVANWMASIAQRDGSFRALTLGQLDHVPRPVHVVAPIYPAQLAQAGRSGPVTVSFYIDRTGAVRLPCVGPGTDPALASLAIDALRQWRFQPPLYRGRPVLAQATQVFDFNPRRAAQPAV